MPRLWLADSQHVEPTKRIAVASASQYMPTAATLLDYIVLRAFAFKTDVKAVPQCAPACVPTLTAVLRPADHVALFVATSSVELDTVKTVNFEPTICEGQPLFHHHFL